MSTEPRALNEKGAAILQVISGHNGCDTFTRHALNRNILMSEGVVDLAEKTDLIVSHQHNLKVRAEEFQTWPLYVREDGKSLHFPHQRDVLAQVHQKVIGGAAMAVAVCTDGNSKVPIVEQRIPFTDFPITGLSLWLENGTLMLPGER